MGRWKLHAAGTRAQKSRDQAEGHADNEGRGQMSTAAQIVDCIIADMRDRCGGDGWFDACDLGVQEEIRVTWTQLVQGRWGAKQADLANLLQEAVQTDGAHHKQWYLEQIAGRLGIELPEHDEGIP